jgi:hypothetical protein
MRYPTVRAKRVDGLPLQADFMRYRIEHPDFPSVDAFAGLARSKFERLSRVLDYCSRHAGYDDIAERITRNTGFQSWLQEGAEPSAADAKQPDGFVYLMKSGKHYKIGKTNSLARRSAEIKIEMPEGCIEVHHIRTDDPAGIEAYWHRRFASKRRKGEWFLLAPEDVKAFRRRKNFM